MPLLYSNIQDTNTWALELVCRGAFVPAGHFSPPENATESQAFGFAPPLRVL